jgi:hypothetical protein
MGALVPWLSTIDETSSASSILQGLRPQYLTDAQYVASTIRLQDNAAVYRRNT